MLRASCLLLLVASMAFACGGDDDDDAADAAPAEILTPEPTGAPTAVADGRLTCMGSNTPDPADPGTLELTGYVRTLADPGATAEPPAVEVEAFSAGGAPIGSAFSDPSKDGRIAVSVPVQAEGFTGYVLVDDAAYLPYRFQSNRATTSTSVNGWAWLVTQADVDQWATDLGITYDSSRGVLIGSIHDCVNFGIGATVLQVDGETGGVFYSSGFDAAVGDTFTDASGRFIVPNLPPGNTVIKAFGRLVAGGPLTLLASGEAEVVAGTITSVDLQPR